MPVTPCSMPFCYRLSFTTPLSLLWLSLYCVLKKNDQLRNQDYIIKSVKILKLIWDQGVDEHIMNSKTIIFDFGMVFNFTCS